MRSTIRDVIHAFNEKGLAAPAPRRAGGRPRLTGDEDRDFIIARATSRPAALGRPFTHWSLRKLCDYLARNRDRQVRIGRERLRQILRENGISFQRTRTWKESTDPGEDTKLDRIEHVTGRFPDRCFAVDQFGPLWHPDVLRRSSGPPSGRRSVPAGSAATRAGRE